MTYRTVVPWCVTILVAMAGLGPLHPAAAQAVARVENPVDLARQDETVGLAWSVVREALPAAGPERIRVLDAASGEELLSQALDADGDGAVDSLLFVASFRPREARRFTLLAEPAAAGPPRVFVMHEPTRDDVAWESDRMAYRTYGQGLWALEDLESSGIDVWLKRTRELVVSRWYEAGHDAYHQDTGEGADFFTVGESLGAGGTALWRDGRLYRPLNFADHRIIAGGPVRAVFELTYEPWDAGGVQVSEVKRITMDAGQNLFRSASRYSASGADLVVAAGVVKRTGLVGSTRMDRNWTWLSTWGPVELSGGGHGQLGTGLLMRNDAALGTRETDDHYLVLTRPQPGEPVVFYAGAGWTAGGDFESVEDWWAYLDAFSERLANPLRVTVAQEH
jgi:pectinesterase